jgi:prepilin-type N-terminal cleavage/methylation domain-containing protein
MTLSPRRVARRRGYSLLEMIVVLAVVASFLAMTLPALFRPLGRAELCGAAKQVQAALLDARTRAVESGVAQEFCYEPGGRCYEILARRGYDDGGPAATPRAGAAETSLRPTNSTALGPLRDVLADGIVFADPQNEMRAERLAPSPPADSPVVEEDVSGQRRITLVRFYPNGCGRNARLKLCVSTSWSIEILLRGLTGTVLVGEPRREETDNETSPHESWSPSRAPDSR